MTLDRLAIVGAGAWGTALAALWARTSKEIVLWGHNPERIEQMKQTRENHLYLPGIELPASVRLTSQLEDLSTSDLVILVAPSVRVRALSQSLRPVIRNSATIFLSCTKGIEHGSGKRMSEIIESFFPRNVVAVLSGPNLAIEVSKGLPTATVIGCREQSVAAILQRELGSSHFRIYTTNELTGVELGGALKNIFAIGAGISDGFGLGDNSKSALVTRSLAELLRLGTAMGGQATTFYGLSGVGDLIATCFSAHSRNRRVGEQLGRGQSLGVIASAMKTVAEGIPTTRSAFECARKLNIETPIIDQVYAILYEGKSPQQAMQDLLQRDQKAEQLQFDQPAR
jgi:glycerol-3-phosphate dehydrogenase (NAD(P)+)